MSDITELAEDWANLSIEMESDMGKTAVKLARAYLEQQKELVDAKEAAIMATKAYAQSEAELEECNRRKQEAYVEVEIQIKAKLEQQKQIALMQKILKQCDKHLDYYSQTDLGNIDAAEIIGIRHYIDELPDTSDYVLVKKEPSKEKISALVEWDRTHEYFDANDYMRDLYKSMIVSKE